VIKHFSLHSRHKTELWEILFGIHRRLASAGVFHPHAAAFCDDTFAEETKANAVSGLRLYKSDSRVMNAPHLCRSAGGVLSLAAVLSLGCRWRFAQKATLNCWELGNAGISNAQDPHRRRSALR
jgi:hypothetical protein